MPKLASITPQAEQLLRAARKTKLTAEALERQVIRDVHAGGDADITSIARVLGVTNRQRIYTIIDEPPTSAPEKPAMPVVAYLRGAGNKVPVWDRVRAALWLRGLATVVDRTQAWHLARGGATVVFVDFSTTTAAKKPLAHVTIGLTEARYADDGKGGQRMNLSRISGDEFPRPVLEDGELDEHALARLVATELVATT